MFTYSPSLGDKWIELLANRKWMCFVTALALAVVVFTDWIVPFPENWRM